MAHRSVVIREESGEVVTRDQIIDEKTGLPRTSNLLAPTMVLEGHQSKVYTTRFDPNGELLASAGHDKDIFLWDVYGKCENVGVLKGHTSAVLQVQWAPDGELLFSASADKSACVWDVKSQTKIKKLREHSSVVNAICPSRRGETVLLTGSDDGTAKLWDIRRRKSVKTFDCMYQVTAAALSTDGTLAYTSGIDNDVKVWDYRRPGILYLLQGHQDTITSLSMSPCGSFLLSNSMDNSIRQWDVKPYAAQERCVGIFQGPRHNMDKLLIKCNWSPDQTKIGCGSSDKFVYILDSMSRRILYKLPGHEGSVNEVDFHPTEPIIASCSNDKKIYLGEIAL
eukprot:253825_1